MKKTDDYYVSDLSELIVPCKFRFPETAAALHAYPVSKLVDRGLSHLNISPVCIPFDEWDDFKTLGIGEGPGMEASVLSAFFSEALMPFDRVLFHSVAVRWRNHAYLICAPSGVGKSTQAKYLQELRRNEFEIICGDRPILEFRNFERSIESAFSYSMPEIIVHPSPWNGKENWHGGKAAPLAGLILLERGERNIISSLSPKEAGITAYIQFIHTNRNIQLVTKIAKYTTALLNAVPIWKLTTFQVPDSTRLLLELVFPTTISLESLVKQNEL